MFRWIKTCLFKESQTQSGDRSVVALYAKRDRIVLVPNSKYRRKGVWPNPDRAVVLEADNPDSFGSGIVEALRRSRTDFVKRKPPQEKGDVVDQVTHDLIGVKRKKGFFREVRYAQILSDGDVVTFYPSKYGAIMADLPVYVSSMDNLTGLSSCLQKTIESSA